MKIPPHPSMYETAILEDRIKRIEDAFGMSPYRPVPESEKGDFPIPKTLKEAIEMRNDASSKLHAWRDQNGEGENGDAGQEYFDKANHYAEVVRRSAIFFPGEEEDDE